MDRSGYEADPFHLPQRLRKHFLADAGYALAQFVETHGALFRRFFENQQCPFISDITHQFLRKMIDLLGVGWDGFRRFFRCVAMQGIFDRMMFHYGILQDTLSQKLPCLNYGVHSSIVTAIS